MSAFVLDPRLAGDTLSVGELQLSRVLLFDDARYPWVILVPRRAGIREIHHLAPAERFMLLDESCRVAAALEQLYAPDKLNIGALGNLVPQLHLHHVARYRDDPAWPGPVWGHSARQPYADSEARARVDEIRGVLMPWGDVDVRQAQSTELR